MSGIGERIKLARTRARLSMRDLADQIGVSAMAISKYEKNQMMPSQEVLLHLADVLDVRLDVLLRPAPDLILQPLYRKHSRLGTKAQAAILADVQEWLERYLQIESFFPEHQPFTWPSGFPHRVRTPSECEDAAEALRNAWRIGTDAIENLTELLEAHGIKVGLVECEEELDALTVKLPDGSPVIAVNRLRPTDRLRFNLAHELGHLFIHPEPPLDEEKAAHAFAGAFLLPAETVRRELGSRRQALDPYELMALKEKYGVSMAAWLYRAHSLDILDDQATNRMWRDFSRYGWRKQEPVDLSPEEPSRMQRLVRRLVAEGILSEARAAELTGESIRLNLSNNEEILALHC